MKKITSLLFIIVSLNNSFAGVGGASSPGPISPEGAGQIAGTTLCLFFGLCVKGGNASPSSIPYPEKKEEAPALLWSALDNKFDGLSCDKTEVDLFKKASEKAIISYINNNIDTQKWELGEHNLVGKFYGCNGLIYTTGEARVLRLGHHKIEKIPCAEMIFTVDHTFARGYEIHSKGTNQYILCKRSTDKAFESSLYTNLNYGDKRIPQLINSVIEWK